MKTLGTLFLISFATAIQCAFAAGGGTSADPIRNPVKFRVLFQCELTYANPGSNPVDSFTLNVSRRGDGPMSSRLLVDGEVFDSSFEYQPEGIYFYGDAGGSAVTESLFSTWDVLRGEEGTVEFRDPYANPEATYLCRPRFVQG